MDLERLKTFCLVVEKQSFSQAAELVSRSQPAISQQMTALEEFYGARLFDREARGVVLTEAGQILYQYAKQLLRLHGEAQEALDGFKGLKRGELAVGAAGTIAQYFLPRPLGAFRQRHPHVVISLIEADTDELCQLLRDRKIHLAFIEEELSSGGLIATPFFTDELVLAVHKEHPWTMRSSVPLAEVAKEPFICHDPDNPLQRFVEETFHAAGIDHLNRFLTFSSTEAVKAGVESSLGVSILSLYTITKERTMGTIAVVPIEEGAIARELTMLSVPGRYQSPATQELTKLVTTWSDDDLIL
ncbi:MAG: LysR family transcriptional regulator [bacterium]|nr:LysR family transcriptional regulator [bacterium]